MRAIPDVVLDLVFVEEAAELLRTSSNTLAKFWREPGASPEFIKVGRRVAYLFWRCPGAVGFCPAAAVHG